MKTLIKKEIYEIWAVLLIVCFPLIAAWFCVQTRPSWMPISHDGRWVTGERMLDRTQPIWKPTRGCWTVIQIVSSPITVKEALTYRHLKAIPIALAASPLRRIMVMQVSESAMASCLKSSPKKKIYLANPRGWIILQYKDHQPEMSVYRDLKALLKSSGG